jgi:hypothetical protein
MRERDLKGDYLLKQKKVCVNCIFLSLAWGKQQQQQQQMTIQSEGGSQQIKILSKIEALSIKVLWTQFKVVGIGRSTIIATCCFR